MAINPTGSKAPDESLMEGYHPNTDGVERILEDKSIPSRTTALIELAKGDSEAFYYIIQLVKDYVRSNPGHKQILMNLGMVSDILDIMNKVGQKRTNLLTSYAAEKKISIRVVAAIIKNHALKFNEKLTGVKMIYNNLIKDPS